MGSTNYQICLSEVSNLPAKTQFILWFTFFISFAIKIPMFPFHIWLPLAHTEGNTSGSLILAAILLKFGTYGFFRYLIPFFPLATPHVIGFVSILAIIGVIFSSISA